MLALQRMRLASPIFERGPTTQRVHIFVEDFVNARGAHRSRRGRVGLGLRQENDGTTALPNRPVL